MAAISHRFAAKTQKRLCVAFAAHLWHGWPPVNLFEAAAAKDTSSQPLAERLRPRSIDEMVGQTRLLGPKGPLRQIIQRGEIPSMILWGPPGSGKTTLARVLAGTLEAEFESGGALKFSRREFEVIVNDRALAPNTAETYEALKPELEAALVSVLGGVGFTLEHRSDPRSRFGVNVKTAEPYDLEAMSNAKNDAISDTKNDAMSNAKSDAMDNA